MQRRSDSSQTGRTLAVIGGGALLAWWLLRRGSGPGGRSSRDATGTHGGGTPAPAARPRVWVRTARIEVDGVVADLPTVIARGRAAGAVDVHATGDAVTRVIRDVVSSLRAAGVAVYGAPDLVAIAPVEPLS